MAPERTPRPGGIGLPGMRNSAPGRAASLARTTDATPFEADAGPSREDVRQRINSLYDHAETATGNYNATRAMATGARRRVDPVLGNERRPADPAVENISRQWFDVARARLGPTVPAVLPADRIPDPPAESRPTRAGNALTGPPREGGGRTVPELTTGMVSGPVAGLTARAVAALPAAPETRQESLPVLPAPTTEPPHSSLRTSKGQIQRKLTAARELLSRHAAQQQAPLLAIEAGSAEAGWYAREEPARYETGTEWQRQQSPGLGADMPLGAGMSVGMAMPVHAAMPLDTGMPTDTGMPVDAGMSIDADRSIGADRALSTGSSASDSEYGRKAVRALVFARGQIGRPCVWGATGPDSYDCASLTQAAWRAAGVELPRTAHDQASAGAVIPLADIQPGDLIFFYANVSHVGLCTGNGMMIHAPSLGTSIREESIFHAGESAIHCAVRPA